MNKPALLLMAFVIAAGAQSVEIYSEFTRLDPFGRIVPLDKGWQPREVLSPGVPRNGHLSFHVAVSAPPKESYLLYVVTNPIDACRVSMYREHFVKTRHGWVPDRLVELHRLPDFGTMPDPDNAIEGQTTRLYLLDVWIPPDASAGRFRLEVQLKVADWIVRPMEIRVLPASVPALREGPAPPATPIDAPSDAPAYAALAAWLDGATPSDTSPPRTLRDIIRRNATLDMALAESLGAKIGGRDIIRRRALDLFGPNLRFYPRPLGAEWYLRLRDFLFAP
jgi:hypothetical protein